MTNTLMLVDRERSTVTIHGRLYPAVGLICPLSDEHPLDVRQRALASGGGDGSLYVPAENGLLFLVEESRNETHHGLSLSLSARTCELDRRHGESMWLPRDVGLAAGRLVNGHSPQWYWAEPDWVAETIDRLSILPFEQPDGPACQLVRLNHFDDEEINA